MEVKISLLFSTTDIEIVFSEEEREMPPVTQLVNLMLMVCSNSELTTKVNDIIMDEFSPAILTITLEKFAYEYMKTHMAHGAELSSWHLAEIPLVNPIVSTTNG